MFNAFCAKRLTTAYELQPKQPIIITRPFKVGGKKGLIYHNHKGSLQRRTKSRFQIHVVLEHGW